MINDLMKIIANQQAQRLTLKGKTIKWNNFVKNGNFASNSDWTIYGGSSGGTLVIANNKATITYNGTFSSDYSQGLVQENSLVQGHKYFGTFYVKLPRTRNAVFVELNGERVYRSGDFGNQTTKIDFISNLPNKYTNQNMIYPVNISRDGETMEISNFIVIDLTLLFGANNEPSTLAEFYATDLGKAIQNGYYPPYTTENKIISVKTPFTFKGRNLFNYKTEYDTNDFNLNGNVLENKRVDERTNDYFNFTIYDYDLHGDGFGKTITTNGRTSLTFTPTHSGEYMFYHSGSSINLVFLKCYLENGQTYTISFDVISHDSRVLGGLKLANIQLEKGNKATPYLAYDNQLVYTRTKRVDLGTLTWAYDSANKRFYANISDLKVCEYGSSKPAPNIRCCRYETKNTYYLDQSGTDKLVSTNNSVSTPRVFIKDLDYNNATTFKNSLSGVILEYETAEPLELNGFDNDGYVDLGTLNWQKRNANYSGNGQIFYCDAQGSLGFKNAPKFNAPTFNCIQENLIPAYWEELEPNEMIIASNYVVICVNISIQDTTALQSRINGVVLTYETNTPSVYDTFENHSGKVVRKIGKIKLNDATINYSSHKFVITLNDIESWAIANQPSENIKVADYPMVSLNELFHANYNCIAQGGNDIFIIDIQYTSVSALKSAKGNVVIYYKLATPTTETERSVLVDHRYTKVADANEIEIDTD